MSTHGYINIHERDNKTTRYRLCAYSSGHVQKQIKDLIDMPFVLFRRACNYALAQIHDPAIDRRFLEGPWYMLPPLLCLVKHPDREPEKEKDYHDYSSVVDYFRSTHPIDCTPASLAHWMVSCHFDRWYVCWKDEQISYKESGPDIIVHVGDVGYTIRPHRSYSKEHFVKWAADAVAAVEPLQVNVPPDERVGLREDGNKVYVPFPDITRRLVHHYLVNRTWEKEEADGKARFEARVDAAIAARAQGVVPNG